MEAVEGNSGQMSPYALVTDQPNLIEYAHEWKWRLCGFHMIAHGPGTARLLASVDSPIGVPGCS
jgi:hypothetical protein